MDHSVTGGPFEGVCLRTKRELGEFSVVDSYNNSFHFTIDMTLDEALYGRRYTRPMCWLEPRENLTLGPEVVEHTMKKVKWIQERMMTS